MKMQRYFFFLVLFPIEEWIDKKCFFYRQMFAYLKNAKTIMTSANHDVIQRK